MRNAWTKRSYCLQARKVELDHMHENIAADLRSVSEEWQVKKLAAVCTDNAANVTKAVREGLNDCAHLPCAAHTLQLCVEDVLADVRLS